MLIFLANCVWNYKWQKFRELWIIDVFFIFFDLNFISIYHQVANVWYPIYSKNNKLQSAVTSTTENKKKISEKKFFSSLKNISFIIEFDFGFPPFKKI